MALLGLVVVGRGFGRRITLRVVPHLLLGGDDPEHGDDGGLEHKRQHEGEQIGRDEHAQEQDELKAEAKVQ